MRRISAYDRIGWCAVGLIALMLAPSWPYAAIALVVAVVAIRMGAKYAVRRAERRRLASDAAFQHQALMEGSDRIGVFGRYQPPTVPGGEVIIPVTPWKGRQEQLLRERDRRDRLRYIRS